MTTTSTSAAQKDYSRFSFNFKLQQNPFASVTPDHAKADQNKGKPNLTAKYLLDLILPVIKGPTKPTYPSVSAAKNFLFWVHDVLLWDQFEDIFPKDLGGYPNNIIDETQVPPGYKKSDDDPWPPRFYPENKYPEGQGMDLEAQAVSIGRKYILDAVTTILRHKIIGIKYDVEHEVTGNVPKGVYEEGVKPEEKVTTNLAGYVDAVWLTDKDGPFAFCEFKRWGVLRDNLWKAKGQEQLGQDPTKEIYLSSSAQHVLQQVVKYAWCTNKLYFMVCDWERVLFLRIPKELPLEALTVYWRSMQVPANETLPKPSGTTEKQWTKSENGWPVVPIQAVMSTDPALFKMQILAFVWKSYEDRDIARKPWESRKPKPTKEIENAENAQKERLKKAEAKEGKGKESERRSPLQKFGAMMSPRRSRGPEKK